MILAVADTTLLSNFAHTQRPDLPPLAFPGLAMPSTVREELADGERLGLLPPLDWSPIPVIEPDPTHLVEIGRLTPSLDRGEIACLALARMHEAVAITDDLDARTVAQALGLRVSGTLGALIQLVRQEHLTPEEGENLLATMITAGYRSPKSSLKSYL